MPSFYNKPNNQPTNSFTEIQKKYISHILLQKQIQHTHKTLYSKHGNAVERDFENSL